MGTLLKFYYCCFPLKYLSTEDVKAWLTPQNDATNSFISGFTTIFLSSNIEPKYASIKNSTQSQFFKSSPNISFYFKEKTQFQVSITNH